MPPTPIVRDAEIAVVGDEFSGDSPSLVFYVFATDLSSPPDEYYRVFFTLISTNSGHTLQGKTDRINFVREEPIGPQCMDYRNDRGGDRLDIMGYDESRSMFGGPWRYFDKWAAVPRSMFQYKIRSLTEFHLGFRIAAEDGNHFGWLQFTRSDTAFTNAFDLTAYDWNPIPEAPIRAGLPPEIPLVTEVVDDGSGQPVLRVSWNPALATWIFETTADLMPPVTWTEYPAGGTSAEVPLDGGETHRYFRLRRP